MDKEGRRVGVPDCAGRVRAATRGDRPDPGAARATAPSSTTSERSARTARSATSASGCEHFRTDPSHLPDLYAYLERLLETRERLRVARAAARASGRATKAIPADAEIRTVRTLIRAGEDTLNELAPGERAKLLELFRVLRATRARMDGTIADRAGRRDPQPRADVHSRRRSRRCPLCRRARTGPSAA